MKSTISRGKHFVSVPFLKNLFVLLEITIVTTTVTLLLTG